MRRRVELPLVARARQVHAEARVRAGVEGVAGGRPVHAGPAGAQEAARPGAVHARGHGAVHGTVHGARAPPQGREAALVHGALEVGGRAHAVDVVARAARDLDGRRRARGRRRRGDARARLGPPRVEGEAEAPARAPRGPRGHGVQHHVEAHEALEGRHAALVERLDDGVRREDGVRVRARGERPRDAHVVRARVLELLGRGPEEAEAPRVRALGPQRVRPPGRAVVLLRQEARPREVEDDGGVHDARPVGVVAERRQLGADAPVAQRLELQGRQVGGALHVDEGLEAPVRHAHGHQRAAHDAVQAAVHRVVPGVGAGELGAVEAVGEAEELLAERDRALVHHGHVQHEDGALAEAREERAALREAERERRDHREEGVEQRVEAPEEPE
eukprot:CAMPEP_0119264148 /NCGR_PEP_ID=MMETSP1329-20130426/3313_1 /TAXON_ID=114041 /ORGANISM="Genus nov. species nov., Strain RCC1024" /LENGTH=388 /DNA_ID=CAMNT_0007263893 /DNA_START=97 /DNA_END=1263 /DNA_ORIENTATION=+